MSRESYLEAVASCPGHRVLDRLGDKWVSLILKELGDGPRRSAALSRTLAGTSQKMRTQTLRTLERDGLVARSSSGGAPSRVEYRLTPLGAGLLAAMQVVVGWAEEHIDEIDQAHAAYDARATSQGEYSA